MCSATGSGHVITCTARRWVVSGRLYCFQRPPAEGRREACKPSTDPTSRITNVRINRTAAHRSSFPPILRCGALPYTKYGCTAAPRLGEKSCSFFQPGIRQTGSTYRKYAIAALPSAGRKIQPKEWRVSFSLHRRALSWRKIQSIFRLNRRRLIIGRTKNYSSSSDRICSINRS